MKVMQMFLKLLWDDDEHHGDHNNAESDVAGGPTQLVRWPMPIKTDLPQLATLLQLNQVVYLSVCRTSCCPLVPPKRDMPADTIQEASKGCQESAVAAAASKAPPLTAPGPQPAGELQQ